ncbi:acyl carrier protein [Streptomyces griseoloalbus]|uniref:acyl carrier protein n=1 Tax=Streptomyces griseoloalbus TaxID=67303 RepID=UPI0033ABB88C
MQSSDKTASTTQPVVDVVLETIIRVMRQSDITLADNVLELGVDSLTGTRIVVAIGEKLEIEVSLETLLENPVIGDFSDAVIEIFEDWQQYAGG